MKEQLLKVAGGFLALGMVAASSANAGGLVIAEFELGDHPDGSAALPYYGLRLDNILAPGVVTLSMDHHNNTRMTVIEDNGMLSMHITGTLYGGEISGNAYVDAQSYEVDFTYALNVSDAGNGWEVNGFDAGNTNDDGSMSASGSQDWLFTANKVPAPSGIAVLGLGGMIATRRRR